MIPTIDDLRAGRTPAEIQGLTGELGRAIAALGEREARTGDPGVAAAILEGLAVTNPRDPIAWALLSQVERRRGFLAKAVLCAEAAARLAPDDRQVRLVRAEAWLAVPEEAGPGRERRRQAALAELATLRTGTDAVAVRAAALHRALGEG